MVLSMTGYGRAGALLHGRDIKVELRSVNARFFEYSSRLPRSCAFLEDKLKKLVASKVSRGKVELSLSIQTVTAADTVVTGQLAAGRGLPRCAECDGRADGSEKRRLRWDAVPLPRRADPDCRPDE